MICLLLKMAFAACWQKMWTQQTVSQINEGKEYANILYSVSKKNCRNKNSDGVRIGKIADARVGVNIVVG